MTNKEIDLERIMESVHNVFATFDKDNSETLELNELMNLLKACRIEVTTPECEIILREMDANQDGVMDFGEFMTFLGMVFKIRFSSQTRLKEEFQLKLRQASKNKALKHASRKDSKPVPPPRKGSVIGGTYN